MDKATKLFKGSLGILLSILVIVLFIWCADVSSRASSCVTSTAYGFWGGFWHGLTASLSLIGSLFNDDITMYAYNSVPFWYDWGFVAGISTVIKGLNVWISYQKRKRQL